MQTENEVCAMENVNFIENFLSLNFFLLPSPTLIALISNSHNE